MREGWFVAIEAREVLQQIAQECISVAPVIILGSGASAAHGIPGMPQLRDRLLVTSPPVGAPLDATSWYEFLEKLKTTDLESALSGVQMPERVTRHIVEATWDFLAPHDVRTLDMVMRDRNSLPLTGLFRHLFQSTHVTIDVVTPNYDRLAEFAADAGEFCHFTGFSYGHIRHRAKEPIPRIRLGKQDARTVNVWKVHGSFDWFADADGIVVGLPVSGQRPNDLVPVIVTPGIEKYRLTHDEPFRSIQQGADAALQSARGYLCVGYGFNDPHVQTKLVERCRSEPVPLVLITKQISTMALEFLRSGKCKKYIAVEEDVAGCKIYAPDFPDGVVVVGKPYWMLNEFVSLVT